VKSLDVVSIYSALVQTQQQASQANKIRRFVATDGYKDLEGVKWSNGRVGVMCLKKGCSSYESWDAFKLYHPGCEITWIDQEVSSDN
jgi:hypothetical protein